MAQAPTLYRFRLELNDVDRGVYETLDIRQAKHPSEGAAYLLTRILAYALNFRSGLEFSPQGLADPDAPALFVRNLQQEYDLWIEIGNPGAKKLHRASKATKQLKIYTYKDPQLLYREVANQKIHRLEAIELFAIHPKFLDQLGEDLQRDVRWQLLLQEGLLSVNAERRSYQCEIRLQHLFS